MDSSSLIPLGQVLDPEPVRLSAYLYSRDNIVLEINQMEHARDGGYQTVVPHAAHVP